ncbi:hypothetical protein M2200_001388 [Bradyrhizobium elkanii]|nr:hypothetical protein [Bradyrhizobium elkanii]
MTQQDQAAIMATATWAAEPIDPPYRPTLILVGPSRA